MIDIARERTIVKLAVAELSKFIDYVLTNIRINGIENDVYSRIRVSNLLILVYKYLADFPQISYLISDIARFILNKQVSRGNSHSSRLPEELNGAWCELEDPSGVLLGESVEITDDVYSGIVYQTSRALEALGYSRGMSVAPIIRGFNFLGRFFNKVTLDGLETKHLVPILDAIYACFERVSYDQSQKVLLPIARRIYDLALEIDPEVKDLHTQDIVFKIKLLERQGLGPQDLRRISSNIESKILKYILKGIEWLVSFDVEAPPRVHELLMDFLTNSFGGVFDIYKDENLMYFISNTEALVNIIHKLSDKKFAQFILDQATEYVSDVLLPGVDDIYSATKLLLVTKILIESRGIIRR